MSIKSFFNFVSPKRERLEPPNAMVIDVRTGWGLELLKKEELKGHQLEYEGQYVHYMVRDKENKLSPMSEDNIKGQLPDELYRTLICKEVDIVFSPPKGLLEKLNTTALYVLIALFLFFIFIILSN